MADKFAKLVVALEAESAKLTTELDKANRKLDRFSKTANKSLGAFSTAAKAALGAFTVGAVVSATRNAIDYADSIDKAARATALAPGFLQELRYAADISGVSVEQLDKAMQQFNKTVGEELVRGTSTATDSFKYLGIELRDATGAAKNNEQIFYEIVKALESVESESKKAGIAAQLFGGRAGPKLVALLNEGTAGIDSFREAARSAGVVLEDELVAQAVEAKDAMTKLSTQSKVLSTQFTLEVAPAITAITTAMSEAIKEGGLLEAAWVALGGVGAALFTDEFSDVHVQIKNAEEELATLQYRLKNRADKGEGIIQDLLYGGTVEELEAEIDRVEGKIAALKKSLEPKPKPEPTGGDGSTLGDENLKGQREAETAAKKYRDQLQKLQDVLDPAAAKTRKYGEEVAFLQTALDNHDISATRHQELLAILADNYTGASEAAEEQRKAMEDLLANTIAAVDPTAALVDELDRLDELLNSDVGAEYGEVIMERMLQIQDEMTEMVEKNEEAMDEMSTYAEEAARNIQDAFADFLYDPFDKGLEGMLDGFVDMLRRMAAEAASAQILEGLGSSSTFGSLLGAIGLGGARAMGGPVTAGVPYLVGERNKPEIFVPNTAGKIMPSAGGSNISVTVNVQGGADGSRESANQIGLSAARAIQRAQQRNG